MTPGERGAAVGPAMVGQGSEVRPPAPGSGSPGTGRSGSPGGRSSSVSAGQSSWLACRLSPRYTVMIFFAYFKFLNRYYLSGCWFVLFLSCKKQVYFKGTVCIDLQ